MSKLVTPFLILNVGCETIYVVEQRLSAQKISSERSAGVLNDTIAYLLDANRLKKWFEPKVGSTTLTELRAEMERLVNSSNMKITGSSMDKLFDLGIMMVKYQMMASAKVEQLVDVTRLHLAGVAAIIDRIPGRRAADRVTAAQRLVEDNFGKMGRGELHRVRQCVLQVLQGQRIKISLLLEANIQTQAGAVCLPTPISVTVGVCGRYDMDGKYLSGETVEVFSETDRRQQYFNHPAPLGSNLFAKDRVVLPPDNAHVDTHFGPPLTPVVHEIMHRTADR